MLEWAKKNRLIAGIIAVLLLGVLAAAYDAIRHRSMVAEMKKSEKEQSRRIESLERDGQAKDEAWQKAFDPTQSALRGALAGVKQAQATIAQIEATRRDLWSSPGVDNGDLVARFDRALGRLQ